MGKNGNGKKASNRKTYSDMFCKSREGKNGNAPVSKTKKPQKKDCGTQAHLEMAKKGIAICPECGKKMPGLAGFYKRQKNISRQANE